MPLIAKENSGPDIPLIDENVYMARCAGVIDLGTHTNEYQGETYDKRDVVYFFEVASERIELEIDGEKRDLPRWVHWRGTNSLGDRAAMRPLIEGWRGRAFTKEERQGFNLEPLPGLPVQIQVLHKVGPISGRTRAVITQMMPVPKGFDVPALENDPIFYSIEDHGQNIPDAVPKWVKEVIMESHEWLEMKGEGEVVPVPAGEPAPDFVEADDDDLPF